MKKQLESYGLEFDELFYERCEKFINMLQDWGTTHNFTSPKALSKYEIEANIIDSVYPLKFLNSFNSFADIGTGAGYPGMLLAIARPDARCALIEPKAKRVAFLNFVKNILKLENVTVIHKRAQDIAPSSYDLITSRAVTNSSLLLSITNNLVHNDTEFLFYKGSLLENELENIKMKNHEIYPFGDFRNYLYIKREGLF
jgi:16S rRNA (guanine527-N7)-methyltransferase